MMQFMRDRVKMIYWVVILSFVLLMFLGWGVGDWQAPNRVASTGTVVVVNGEEVPRSAWDQRSAAILRQMRARSGDTSADGDVLRARDQAYDELVLEVLQRQEAERRGIGVTESEIDEVLQNDPPPYLLAPFTDEAGNVDYDAYYSALNSPTTDWARVRDQLRTAIPMNKLSQQIAGEALVGEAELRTVFEEQTARMVAEWVGVLFSDIDLGEGATASDEEVQAWYDAHLEDFRQDAQARVRVVTSAKRASEDDEAEVLSILNEIRQDVVEGRLSFEEAARTYSEDTSASTGGDLGFFDRNRMTPPFTEAAFDLALGDVSEPVKTQFGYHLIECTDERLDDSGAREQIQARHILLRLHPSQMTLDELRDAVYSARDAAATIGIDTAAEEAGFSVIETPGFSEGMNIPGIAGSLTASRFAFDRDTGTLSEVFENDDAIYFFEVGEQVPAGYSSLEDVRAIVESNVLRDRRVAAASEKLGAAIASVTDTSELETLANSNDLSHAVTDTFGVRDNIPDVGFASAFGRTAMQMNVGDFCPRVETPRGVYALRLLYRNEFDQDAFRAQRNSLAASMLYGRQQGALQQWLAEQLENAEIEDLRNSL
jgi:parvulin-like peptidyl-prolyl isomerase